MLTRIEGENPVEFGIVRHPYDGLNIRVGLDCSEDEGKTEQHHKDRCNITTILKKYDKTGLITHVNNAVAHYGDYTEVNEYKEACNLVITAENNFMSLPSDVRKRFGNDPGEFFEFATDPANLDEMINLGLAEKILP